MKITNKTCWILYQIQQKIMFFLALLLLSPFLILFSPAIVLIEVSDWLYRRAKEYECEQWRRTLKAPEADNG